VLVARLSAGDTAVNGPKADFCDRLVMAETAEIDMSPVDSATGRDVPHTRLRAIVATPSGSTADQASPRRQRQHFRVRDPKATLASGRFGAANAFCISHGPALATDLEPQHAYMPARFVME